MDAEQRYAGGLFQTTLTGVLSMMSWIAYDRMLTRLIVLCHKTLKAKANIHSRVIFLVILQSCCLMSCIVVCVCVSGQSVGGERLSWVDDGSHSEDIHNYTESTCRLQKLAADGCLLQTDGNNDNDNDNKYWLRQTTQPYIRYTIYNSLPRRAASGIARICCE